MVEAEGWGLVGQWEESHDYWAWDLQLAHLQHGHDDGVGEAPCQLVHGHPAVVRRLAVWDLVWPCWGWEEEWMV